MIGFSNPGKLIVQNIKMFEQTWTDAQTVLPTTLTPGYTLMLVGANLVKSTKLFNGALMTASDYPTIIYVHSGDKDATDALFQIEDMGNQKMSKFFTNPTFGSMMGKLSPDQTGVGSTFFRLKYAGGTVPSYNDISYNPYCYLSLAYYLVPTI